MRLPNDRICRDPRKPVTDAKVLGQSGPMQPDSSELEWAKLPLAPGA